MTATLLLLLKLSVALIILAIGMDSTPRDMAYLWRRPGLLLRSLLAMPYLRWRRATASHPDRLKTSP